MNDLNNEDWCEQMAKKPHLTGCDCCDPTSPSPDPVVVRLEREIDELSGKAGELEAANEELRAEVERLNTAWKAIDRANESLREQLGTAEADVETARTAARYLADALLHGGDGRHYMQALAFWPWIQTVVANESAKGNEVKCRGCGKDTGLPGVEVLGLGHMHLMCEIARLNDALTLSKQIIAMAEADRDKHRQRLAAAEAEIKRLQTTPYNSGDDDGRNHFEIEAAKGGRDGAE